MNSLRVACSVLQSFLTLDLLLGFGIKSNNSETYRNVWSDDGAWSRMILKQAGNHLQILVLRCPWWVSDVFCHIVPFIKSGSLKKAQTFVTTQIPSWFGQIFCGLWAIGTAEFVTALHKCRFLSSTPRPNKHLLTNATSNATASTIIQQSFRWWTYCILTTWNRTSSFLGQQNPHHKNTRPAFAMSSDRITEPQ